MQSAPSMKPCTSWRSACVTIRRFCGTWYADAALRAAFLALLVGQGRFAFDSQRTRNSRRLGQAFAGYRLSAAYPDLQFPGNDFPRAFGIDDAQLTIQDGNLHMLGSAGLDVHATEAGQRAKRRAVHPRVGEIEFYDLIARHFAGILHVHAGIQVVMTGQSVFVEGQIAVLEAG